MSFSSHKFSRGRTSLHATQEMQQQMDSLRSKYDRLQGEQAQLLQHHHILSSLAEALQAQSLQDYQSLLGVNWASAAAGAGAGGESQEQEQELPLWEEDSLLGAALKPRFDSSGGTSVDKSTCNSINNNNNSSNSSSSMDTESIDQEEDRRSFSSCSVRSGPSTSTSCSSGSEGSVRQEEEQEECSTAATSVQHAPAAPAPAPAPAPAAVRRSPFSLSALPGCKQQCSTAPAPQSAPQDRLQEDQDNTKTDLLSDLQQPVCPDSDPFLLLRMIWKEPTYDQVPHRQFTLAELREMWTSDVQQLAAYLAQLQDEPAGAEAEEGATAGGACGEQQVPSGAPASAGSGSTAAAGDADMCSSCSRSRSKSPGGDSSCCCCISNSSGSSSAVRRAQQQQAALQGIKDVQMRMFILMRMLCETDQDHMVFLLQLTNWHTGEFQQEPCKQRHRDAVRALELTPAQQQRMLAGWQLYQRLHSPIILERQQLHQEGLTEFCLQQPGAVAAAAACPSTLTTADSSRKVSHPTAQGGSSGSGGGGGGSGSGQGANSSSNNSWSSGAAARIAVAYSDQGARLQAHKEQVARLHLLRRKDITLRGAMAAYFQGCLSWVQQAKLRVYMSPYHQSAATLALVIAEDMQQQQPKAYALSLHHQQQCCSS